MDRIRISFGALLALALATGGALAQEVEEGPPVEGGEIGIDAGGETGWEGDVVHPDGEEVVDVDTGGDGWLDGEQPAEWVADDGEIVTVQLDGETQEGVIVGEDLAESEEGGSGLLQAGAEDGRRSEWGRERLGRSLAAPAGDRSEDAPMVARGSRRGPDGAVARGGCASDSFRGALFCDLR